MLARLADLDGPALLESLVWDLARHAGTGSCRMMCQA